MQVSQKGRCSTFGSFGHNAATSSPSCISDYHRAGHAERLQDMITATSSISIELRWDSETEAEKEGGGRVKERGREGAKVCVGI